ncbi:hypothetical protein [Agrococcus sp. ProA11]|uniref:hypothetical protein n=1 Tax=Agrococcus chionoecetis TaxID=3153752 RepID=UPI00325FFE16
MPIDILRSDGDEPLRLRRDASMLRLRRGAYVDRASFEALPEDDRHAVLVRAVAASRPGAVFARESALALARLPHGRPGAVFTIGDPRASGRRHGVVNAQSPIADVDVLVEDGIARCTPAYALAHLARVGRQVDAVGALDAALHHRIVTKDEVTDALTRQGPRGQRRAAWVVAFADALAESVGESFSRVQLHRLGAPAPLLQVRVQTRLGPRFPDFLWERPGKRPLGGEFDGAWKYGVIADANGVQPVDAVIREKRREDALREHIDTLHWMWDHVMRPRQLGAMLAQAHIPVRATLLPGW